MDELLSWLSLRARVEARRPELLDALLTGKHAPYAWHRLRFFLPRLILRLCQHAVEILVLARILPWEFFAPLLSYRASTAFLSATYWGFLEGLRERVRAECHGRHFTRAQRVIAAWLLLSFLLALLSVAFIVLQIRYDDEPGFTLFDAYGFACFTRLALDLVARTFHAGIASVRRVYRPVSTLILPDIVELGFILLAWERLGPWGLPLAILIMAFVRNALLLVYARRTYRLSRVGSPGLLPDPSAARFLALSDLRAACGHALANVTTQLDSLLILALAHAPETPGSIVPLAVLYYVLRPLMGAAQSWTRSFYLDWKKLQHGLGSLFQRAFHRMLVRVGASVGIGLCMLLAAVLTLLGQGAASAAGLTLIPLFVARSLFALEQLEAFSLGRHRQLTELAVVLLLALVVLRALAIPDALFVVIISLVLFVAVVWSWRVKPRGSVHDACAGHPWTWFARLGEQRAPVRVAILTIDRRVATQARVLRALRARFSQAQVAAISEQRLVWFDGASKSADESVAQLLGAAGGAIAQLQRFEASDGRDAQRIPELRSALSADASRAVLSERELLQIFQQKFPQGTSFDLPRGVSDGATLSSLARPVRGALLRSLFTHMRSSTTRPTRDDRFELCILFKHGEPSIAFAMPRESAGIAAFRTQVRQASLALSTARG